MSEAVSTLPTPYLVEHIVNMNQVLCILSELFLFPSLYLQSTLYVPGLSSNLDTLLSWTVSVKAGQGEECLNLERLENSWWSHLEHT